MDHWDRMEFTLRYLQKIGGAELIRQWAAAVWSEQPFVYRALMYYAADVERDEKEKAEKELQL